jgi:hypothetical protein
MSKYQLLRSPLTYGLALAMAAAASIALACADAPTKPTALVTSSSRSAVMETRGVATPLIDDASGRLSSAIEDAVARDELRSLLNQLSSALDKGDERNARDCMARLRKLIASRADAPDAADLATIGLALDHIESQLNKATQPEK